jgi:signal transduction histidine kinase/ActR/RegA family two-component response regulator
MLLEEADRQILNGSKDRVDLEFDIDWRGERHWFRDIKFPIRQADGSRIIGGLAIDISSQKKYEQELLKAKNLAEAGNRVKGAFLANMSHEMRTPLNGLLGMINLLQSENLSPTGKTYLDIAVLSAQKMHAIVEDLITLADLENHEPVLYSELVDVKEQFITVCDGIKNNLQEKGLELILSLPEESVQLRTIPPRFSQVILGLISNAVKFSEDGQITVKLQRAQDGITFSVTDQGIGIPKDRIEEIFEPLRQLEDPYTKKFAGIGAGLSIVKKIMDTLGGTITVDSEVGLGTTFTVTMPNLQQQGEESIPSPVISPAEEHLDRGTEAPQILIVEDEAVNRLYLKMILGRMGCTVLEAADGYEAILNCEKNSPDLIFMDIGLPELNGVETTARIRQIPRMSDKPVIALTAHTHSDDVKSFLEGGLNQVIKKPFMEGQIRLVLENYLDESRLTAQKK